MAFQKASIEIRDGIYPNQGRICRQRQMRVALRGSRKEFRVHNLVVKAN
jgi:hypothetical protein